MNTNIEDLYINYLSYQDADISEEQKQKMLDSGMTKESSYRYATALENLFQRYTFDRVHQLAKLIHEEFKRRMNLFGKPSAYGLSMSWVYWDLAKQYYYYLNPSVQINPRVYMIADPMVDTEVQKEIMFRHIGWEVYHHQDILSAQLKLFKDGAVTTLLNLQPKEDGQIKAYQYVTIGRFLSTL